MGKTLYLHMGGNKTGSTALQQALFFSKDELLAQGIVYPDFSDLFPSKPVQHWPLALKFHERPHQYYMINLHEWSELDVENLLHRVSENFHNQIRQAQRCIVSGEAFANLDFESLQQAKRWFDESFDNIVPIYYARPPGFASFYSMFQQMLKGGQAPSAKQVVKAKVFRQFEQAKKIEKVFPDCLFRVFDREIMVGGDILIDFLRSCGLDDSASIVSSVSTNSSLSLESASLLYFFNKSQGKGYKQHFKIRQEVVRFDRLNKGSLTSVRTLRQSWDDEIKNHFHEGWCDYLELAGSKFQEFEMLGAGAYKENKGSGLLENEKSIDDWLWPHLPSNEFISNYFSDDARRVFGDIYR